MRYATLAVLALLLPSPVSGSDDPRVELFAGYSHLRLDYENRHGGILSGALNVSDRFGIEAELAGHYKSADAISLRSHSFLAGPRFVPFRRTFTPFVHVLVGAVRSSEELELLGVSISESRTRFGGVAGAGVEYRIGDRLGVRVQADLRLVRSPGKTEYDPRASAGVAWRFGDR